MAKKNRRTKARPKTKSPLTKVSKERKQIIRLFIDGRHLGPEITKRVGVDREEVIAVRSMLERRGIRLLVPGTTVPPFVAARNVLMLEVLMQVSLEAPTRCALKLGAIGVGTIGSWISMHPQVLIDARGFRNGYFWREAHEEIAGWIKEVEEEYGPKTGKKYKPSVSLASKVARKRIRAMKEKKREQRRQQQSG